MPKGIYPSTPYLEAMVSEETKQEIRARLGEARAAIAAARRDEADLKRAGLEDVAKRLSERLRQQEVQVAKLEAVYGRE